MRSIDGGAESFVCERVCTSPRLLRRMGGLSKVRKRERNGKREGRTCPGRVYPGPRRALPCVGEVARREDAPRDRGRETQKTQPASSSLPLLLLAQDPTPNTCVTVCGTSGEDACLDACARAVCGNMHQVRGE
jgi:hypothetical protein